MDDTRIYSQSNPDEIKMAGINIDIVKVLGDTLAEQFLSHVSEEELNLIVENAKSEIWTKDFKNETVLKKETSSGYGCYRSESDTKIVAFAKSHFNDKLKEHIVERIKEYIESEEYKAKAEEIVKEIIDYALEGYKYDMINTIRRRLAIDPLSNSYQEFISDHRYDPNEIKSRIDNMETMLQDIVNHYH